MIAIRPDAIVRRFSDRWTLASEQFVAFFRALSASHIEEDAEHRMADDADVLALPACYDPVHIITDHDAEVGFVWAHHRAGGSKSGSHPVPIRWMDVSGKLGEGYLVAPRKPLELKAALIHREQVSINVPGPQRHPGRGHSQAEMFGLLMGNGHVRDQARLPPRSGSGAL